MAGFKGRKKIGFEGNQYIKTGATVDYASPIDTSSPLYIADYTAGTAANQADIFWRGEVSIAGSGAFVLDLNGAANSDIFGTALAMLTLTDFFCWNAPIDASGVQNTTNVTITTTVSGLSGTTILKPGSVLNLSNALAGGLAVITPTTADTITVTNAAGATAKVQISVLGRSV